MNIIFLLILFPLISFFILYFLKHILYKKFIVIIGVGSIFASFIIFCILSIYFFDKSNSIIYQNLWNWWNLEKFKINFCLLLDKLSFSFIGMIVFIGLLVHIFSIWYMKDNINKSNFFAFLNLFIFNMLLLILSDNFIVMYVGWEGVSVCSYLLINFYYYKKYVSLSAFKTFLITKIGDLFLISAILMLYVNYNTLNFYEIQFLIKIHLIQYTPILNYINILLLLGCISKSAQIPLQLWLPTAMVGPAPVSALIHAATMVTAGIYLIMRNYTLFLTTPLILNISGFLGALTLLFSSISAIFQSDIKKILAYSTMSQLGYMFVVLSIGGWGLALSHLITHAFFKALLFLSAGTLIKYCKNEQKIFYMGNNLWNTFPFIYFCFVIGGASLSAFPIITSGFYSKGNILFYILQKKYFIFFIISMLSAFLTTLYIFRLIFIVFHTQSNLIRKNVSINCIQFIPLMILAICSTYVGIFLIPDCSKLYPIFSLVERHTKLYLEIFSSFIIIFSIYLSYYLYVIKKRFFNNNVQYFSLCYITNIIKKDIGLYSLYNVFFPKLYIKITKYFFNKPFNMLNKMLFFIFYKLHSFLSFFEDSIFIFYVMIFFIFLLFMELMIFYINNTILNIHNHVKISYL
ncbi:NADH-quinone oxidoreductase subunit L [Buchnera aphidicola (Pterocallis alni)]|uniref:NADH-quinone oxidoreductase subunit L n=1 Tax=Buchnera aphidicola TaxID=9 RepID=UPI003464AFE0